MFCETNYVNLKQARAKLFRISTDCKTVTKTNHFQTRRRKIQLKNWKIL